MRDTQYAGIIRADEVGYWQPVWAIFGLFRRSSCPALLIQGQSYPALRSSLTINGVARISEPKRA